MLFGRIKPTVWLFCALIVLMAGCKKGESPTDKTRTGSFEAFFEANFLAKTASELDANLSKLIHPSVGVYFIHRPGSVSEVRWFNSWGSILATNEMNQLLVMLRCRPKREDLPNFNCANEFDKKGCFYQEIKNQDWVWNKLRRLKNNYIIQISDREAFTAQKTDSLTSISMIITEAYVRLHFGKVEGKWYLLVVDHEEYDCSL